MAIKDLVKRLVNYRLGGASYISEMAIPPGLNYQRYLELYGEVGWLFGAVSLISNSVAQIDWNLYSKQSRKESKEIEEHPLLDLLDYVNPFQTRYQFFVMMQTYISLVGEAFIVLDFNKLKTPAQMWLAPPGYMSIVPSAKEYISHYEYERGNSKERFELNEVIHIPDPNPANPYRGLGAAKAAGIDVEAEYYAARYQQRLFYNDATPGLILEYPEMPNKETREQIGQEWAKVHQGWRNARKTAFLWGGAKANTIALAPKDMDFANLRQANKKLILGAYHIPDSLIGASEVGSRARAEADEYIFAKYTIKPALTRIRESLNEQLCPLFDESLYLEFDNPVPEDEATIQTNNRENFKAGIITREEARLNLGLEAEPEKGQTYLLPISLIPEETKMLKGGEGSGNFGHAGRPGEVGGSGSGGGGTAELSERAQRARATHKTSTAAVQRQAEDNEPRVAGVVGGKQTGDNEAFDVELEGHAIEIKTIVRGTNDKITMHPDSRQRKLDVCRERGLKPHTVVFDDRVGKVFYREGVGSFRLNSMTRLDNISELRQYIR